MKTLLYIITVLAGCVCAVSCKKEGLMNFNADNSVYFAYTDSAKLDSVVVSFGYTATAVKDSIYKIRVKTMGYMSQEDRPYRVDVINDFTTAQLGVHYDKLPEVLTIKKGKIDDTIYLKLHRTPDMQTKSVVITLGVFDNGTFSNKYPYNLFRIYVNDILTQPKYWLSTYLGTFSRKKINLMAQVLGVSVSDINANSVIAQMIYWGRFTQLYLNDMKAQGQTIYEDDGVTAMIMGPSVQ